MLYAKYSLLYKLAKCALNFAFKPTVFVLCCLFMRWLRFRPLRLFLGVRIVVKKFAYIEIFFEIVEFFLLDIFLNLYLLKHFSESQNLLGVAIIAKRCFKRQKLFLRCWAQTEKRVRYDYDYDYDRVR